MMNENSEKIPDPKEIEKEISDFLSKKFGGNVKMVSPLIVPQEASTEKVEEPTKKERKINFDLLPEDLISYLDQYIVKQDGAKAILATKICTHFNRVKRAENASDNLDDMVGSIKNNILMFGPTGVGKTYLIKLIAKKINVPNSVRPAMSAAMWKILFEIWYERLTEILNLLSTGSYTLMKSIKLHPVEI